MAMLQANRAQNVFMLVVPVMAGARTFNPGEDPVVAAIGFARFADGQRHVVVLLPGLLPADMGHVLCMPCLGTSAAAKGTALQDRVM